jgi:hypothetical protein
MKKIILSLAVLILFASISMKAQEIQADVSIDMQQIEEENRYNLRTMESDIESYINNQKFTEIDWQGNPIPVDISIVLTGGFNNRYAAQIFVASKRVIYGTDGGTSIALKLVDREWSFEYAQGAMLSYNPNRFNEFSSLIDYYMLLVIGFDMDTYSELEGSKVYEKAKQICMLGASQNAPGYDTFVEPGEFTRYSLVSELTDPRYEPLRILIFEYYFDGLDMMHEDRELAKETLAYIIQEMAEFKRDKLVTPSVIIQAFFESKAPELAEIFKGYKKHPQVFSNLAYLDPTNTQIYDEAQRAGN